MLHSKEQVKSSLQCCVDSQTPSQSHRVSAVISDGSAQRHLRASKLAVVLPLVKLVKLLGLPKTPLPNLTAIPLFFHLG